MEVEKPTLSLIFDSQAQDTVIGYLMTDSSFFNQCVNKIRPGFFNDPRNSTIFSIQLNRFNANKKIPTIAELENDEIVYDQFKTDQKRKEFVNHLRKCEHLAKNQIITLDFIKSRITDWMQGMLFREMAGPAMTAYNNGKVGKAFEYINKLDKDRKTTLFEDNSRVMFSDFSTYLEEAETEHSHAIPTGLKLLDEALLGEGAKGGFLRGDMSIIMAPTDAGKCHGIDTPIIMYDGTIKSVQNIKKGDLLMGPDSEPRKVLSTTKGTGPLYRITTKSGGQSFVCNDAHVLSLKTNSSKKMDKGDILNIPLCDFLNKSKNFKRRMHLWRSSVDFSKKNLSIPPYIVGLWLGDGRSDRAVLPTAEHIPHDYMCSSKEQRLELLAGIIDSDGNLNKNAIEITSSVKSLAEDYAFLARSLGFKVTVSETYKKSQNGTIGLYYRLYLRGKLSEIPVLLDRKRGKDNIKNCSTTSFVIEPIGDGDYYGFTLDKDHLYLLGDFTVTHNTTTLITIASHNILANNDVLFMTHEGGPKDIRIRVLCSILTIQNLKRFENGEITPDDIWVDKMALFKLNKTEQGRKRIGDIATLIDKKMIYNPYNKPGMCIEDVEPIIRRLQEERTNDLGKGFDLLISDYPAKLSTRQASHGGLQNWTAIQKVYDYYVQMAIEYHFHALTAIQTNKEGFKVNQGRKGFEKRLLTPEDVAGSYDTTCLATNIITVNRDAEAGANDRLTYNVCKAKNARTGRAIVCKTKFGCRLAHDDLLGSIAYDNQEKLDSYIDAVLSNPGFKNRVLSKNEILDVKAGDNGDSQ